MNHILFSEKLIQGMYPLEKVHNIRIWSIDHIGTPKSIDLVILSIVWFLNQKNLFLIPPLTSRTTKFLSLPLPPGLKIEMCMDHLAGTIDKNSGEVLLKFESQFLFSIGAIIEFPGLIVNTLLKTGKVKSQLHEGEGQVLQNNGKTKLVGISIIPKTGNKILDTFLGLPNEALAELQCEIK